MIILTDLPGGSPSAIAFSFLEKERVEVITGVNLSMILTYWNLRQGKNLIGIANPSNYPEGAVTAVTKNLMETRRAVRRNID